MTDQAPTIVDNSALAPNIGPGSIPAPASTDSTASTAPTTQVQSTSMTNPNVPTTLTGSTISASPGTIQTPDSSPKPDELGSLLTTLSANTTNAKSAYDTAKTNVTGTETDLTNLQNQLAGKTAFSQDQENAAGLPQMNADLLALHNTQSFQTAAYLNATNTAQNGPGGTKGYMNNQVAAIDRQHGLDALTTSALIDAKNSDITTAQAKVDKAVSLQFDPITSQIQTKLQILSDNKDLLTGADKDLADAKTAELTASLQKVTNDQANMKDAISSAMTQVTNGNLDATTVSKAASDLMSGKTDLAGFYKALGITSDGSGTGTNGNGSQIIANTMSMMGVTSDMPVSQAVSKLGMDKIVAGLIKQEGGSPNGVVNNPGNIIFVGQPGATNSGIPMQGNPAITFASFSTPESGTKAVADLVQKAADSGKNLSDFIAAYKGVSNTSSSSTPTYAQYGLLSKTDFNPNNTIDSKANNYLNYYLKNASFPSAASVGISTRSGAGAAQLAKVAARANDLYTQATGQSLPNTQILKGYNDQIVANNKLTNTINIQTSTVGKNFALAVANLDASNLNQNVQPINTFIDSIKSAMGDPAVAQYFAQNATLSNEVGSLLALKNASGTTVHDKLESAGLISNKMTAKQEVQVIQTILAEAKNGQDAITSASAGLYKQVDPLEQDPNNPNRSITNNAAPGTVADNISATYRSKYNY